MLCAIGLIGFSERRCEAAFDLLAFGDVPHDAVDQRLAVHFNQTNRILGRNFGAVLAQTADFVNCRRLFAPKPSFTEFGEPGTLIFRKEIIDRTEIEQFLRRLIAENIAIRLIGEMRRPPFVHANAKHGAFGKFAELSFALLQGGQRRTQLVGASLNQGLEL